MEIGAAGCRNLKYINDCYPNVQLFANDLHRQASFKNMHDDIKEKINFYEESTQTFIKKFKRDDFNLVIDSDHLVHVNYRDVEEIVGVLNTILQPQYILIRSVVKNNPNRKPCPYYKHDFSKLLTHYDEIHYSISKNAHHWYIKLYKFIES